MGNRILIAEDEETLREVMAKICTDIGHEVVTASDGVDALEKLQKAETPYDLLVTDYKMPRMNGLALLATVRKEFPEMEMIMITAFADIQSTVKAMKEGTFDYIPKPIDREVLIKVVARCLEHHQVKLQNQKLAAEAKAWEREVDAHRIKSELFHIMSHEFRTPLTIVLASAELLLLSEKSPDKIENLRMIYNSGHKLLTLTEDLLDMARIRIDGNLELSWDKVGIDYLIKQTIDVAKKEIDEKKIAIKVNAKKEIWFDGDTKYMGRVLKSLLDNAIKFTKVGEITIRVETDAEKIYFSVQDTGCGIRKKDLPFVFMVLRQGDMSDARAYGGTGIGLALAQEVVKMHGGEISVQSEVGRGSTFSFAIPLKRKNKEVV
jgi:signal transduction histidine kinase